MRIAAIDPGQTGGLALIKFQHCIEAEPMPVIPKPKGGGHMLDLPAIVTLLERWVSLFELSHVFLERAHAMPKQGVTSMFNYGMGFGQIEGILATIPLKYTMVEARSWTKVMWEGTAAGESKARSLIVTRRLFPAVKLTVGRSTVPHKGIVDALLIAEYGRRQLAGPPF